MSDTAKSSKPGITAELTEEQEKRFLALIEKHWKEPRHCPICNNIDWGYQNTVMEMRQFADGRFWTGDTLTIPLIPVICTTCGYIRVFSAVQSGVVKQPVGIDKPAEQPDEAPSNE